MEFPDGEVKEYAANIMAKNLLSQVDENGHPRLMMDSIVNYCKNPNKAVAIANNFVATRKGQQQLRKTIQGWDLLVRWRDGTESWASFKGLKDSYPVETAEIAKVRGIDKEPAFPW